MKYLELHRWQVSVKEAFEIQRGLRGKIVHSKIPNKIDKIAAVDVGFKNNQLKAVVCVFKYPSLELLEEETVITDSSFPYVPGLLSFREAPAVLEVFSKIKNKPDIILFDGQGICHPRRLGLASHIGIILDLPSIGCAKSRLCGVYEEPDSKKGSYSYIYDQKTEEKLGAVVRSRNNIKPLFVSVGHKVDLEGSIDLVLKLCPKYRIPEPLRHAHEMTQ